MTETAENNPGLAERKADRRREFRSYAWGLGLALVLTLFPFALVYEHVLPRTAMFIAIGCCALVQMVVHFRFFLHIGFHRQREDLQLILFSTLLLCIMIAGTLWIMVNLAARMVPGM